MKCKYSIEDIVSYLDNVLPVEASQEIKEHLETCENCRKAYQLLSFTNKFISREISADRSINSKIIEGINSNPIYPCREAPAVIILV